MRTSFSGKADFLGINYYTSRICKPMEYCQSCKQRDDDVDVTADHAWPRAQSDWLFSYPDGLRKILKYLYRFIVSEMYSCSLLFFKLD